MIVYRLEDKSNSFRNFTNIGGGVYCGSDVGDYATPDSSDKVSHPNPFDDGDLCEWFDDEWVCCFTTLVSLHNWFSELKNIPNYLKSSVEIVVYRVANNNYHKGGHQAIALAESMVKVDSIPVGKVSNYE